MKKFIQNKLKEQKGLTLIELLAVIVILAIIAAIAVPAIGNIIENSRYSAVKSDALNAIAAANIYYTENPEQTVVLVSKLKTDKYMDNIGKLKGTESIAKSTDGSLAISTVSNDVITYSGSKTLSFSNATVTLINSDTQKGSATGNKTIPGTTPVTPGG